MIQDIENLFLFFGGLGMFLYGTYMMSESMQKVFSGSSKNFLQVITKNTLMGILVGIVVTIITHSSAATTVMVIGFVNAGLMTLRQAVGVIMGANIGTTATAWLISLMELGEASQLTDPSFYAPLLLGISAIFLVFTKKEKIKNSFA
ncbi:MAG: Na/Pi symporter, partial [Lachnospiraceae bacterium]|nr:Na/Pi symporter [Lachnospiraceae bacterium]